MKGRVFSLIVKGRVQGIFFRKKIKKYCDKHSITGLVKNEVDGSVKISMNTTPIALNEFLSWLENYPGFSRVDRIVIEESNGKFDDFKIIRNGNWLNDKFVAFKNLIKSFF